MTIHRITPAPARTWGNFFPDRPAPGPTCRRYPCQIPSPRRERPRFARIGKARADRSTLPARMAFRRLASFLAIAPLNPFLALRRSPKIVEKISPDVPAVPRAPRRASASCFPAMNRERSWDAHSLGRFEFRRLDAAIYQQTVHTVHAQPHEIIARRDFARWIVVRDQSHVTRLRGMRLGGNFVAADQQGDAFPGQSFRASRGRDRNFVRC